MYLISPHSVSKRRYVKSELQIVKAKWPVPWEKVLPVVISATNRSLIDPYLAAATLLEPRGDVAAEVAAATLRLLDLRTGTSGGTLSTIPIQQQTTRIGVISPNLLLNVDDFNKTFEDKGMQWPFETLAKRVAFLFDKIFVSDDLDLTYEVMGSCSGDFDDDPTIKTLRFLHKEGFVVGPTDLGIPRINDFISRKPETLSARLHHELLRIGNPGIEDFQRELLVGQPDVGWIAWHDGWHPRREFVDKLSMPIEQQELLYENLLIRRNMAFLREEGYQDSVIAGQLYGHTADTSTTSVVWRIVIAEMPQLSLDVPWQDVLDFRKEEQTQQLSRGLRRWVRKTASENLSAAEVEDEVRYLLGEYKRHMKVSGMKADRAALEFLVPHDAQVDTEGVEQNFNCLSDLARVTRASRLELLEAEMKAPGRELALIPKLRKRFGSRRSSDGPTARRSRSPHAPRRSLR